MEVLRQVALQRPHTARAKHICRYCPDPCQQQLQRCALNEQAQAGQQGWHPERILVRVCVCWVQQENDDDLHAWCAANACAVCFDCTVVCVQACRIQRL